MIIHILLGGLLSAVADLLVGMSCSKAKGVLHAALLHSKKIASKKKKRK